MTKAQATNKQKRTLMLLLRRSRKSRVKAQRRTQSMLYSFFSFSVLSSPLPSSSSSPCTHCIQHCQETSNHRKLLAIHVSSNFKSFISVVSYCLIFFLVSVYLFSSMFCLFYSFLIANIRHVQRCVRRSWILLGLGQTEPNRIILL